MLGILNPKPISKNGQKGKLILKLQWVFVQPSFLHIYTHSVWPTYMVKTLYFSLIGFAILCRWCFDVELVFLCKWFRIPISEISVNWSEIPGSKVNLLSIPNMLWELVLMSVGYRTGMWRVSNST